MQEHTLAGFPPLRQVEVTAIRTYRILVEVILEGCDEWRFVLERIAHIIIYRHIVSSHLPVERYLEFLPGRNVCVVCPEIILLWLALLPVGSIVKFPLAVEQQIVGVLRSEPWEFEVIVLLHGGSRRIRHESSVRLFLAILKLSLVFYPFVGKRTNVNFGLHHLLHLFLGVSRLCNS